MDPFSIITGTAGLLDVCIRLAKYLKDFQEAAAKVEDEISALLHEFEALIAVNESIKTLFEAELERAKLEQAEPKSTSGAPKPGSDSVQKIWENIGRNLKDCQTVVEKLEEVVEEIVGKGIVEKDNVGKERSKMVKKFEGFRKQRRMESKDSEFRQLREKLTSFQRALHMLMTAITT